MTKSKETHIIVYIVIHIKIITKYSHREKRKERKAMIQGRLGYNSENDRYGLLVSDLWENDGFHCGECLEVMVDGKWVQTRMEMSIDHEWYLVDTPYKGNLEYVQARIDK